MKKTLMTLGLIVCCLPAYAQAPRKETRSARPAAERRTAEGAAAERTADRSDATRASVERTSPERTVVDRPAPETIRGSVLDAIATPSSPTTPNYDLGPIVSGTLSPTPEMWFYSQERSRYDNPKAMVRRKAEIRAAERVARIESQRWFGMEKSRPWANPTPVMGSYSPTWAGNSNNFLMWRGGYAPNYVVLRPAASLY